MLGPPTTIILLRLLTIEGHIGYLLLPPSWAQASALAYSHSRARMILSQNKPCLCSKPAEGFAPSQLDEKQSSQTDLQGLRGSVLHPTPLASSPQREPWLTLLWPHCYYCSGPGIWHLLFSASQNVHLLVVLSHFSTAFQYFPKYCLMGWPSLAVLSITAALSDMISSPIGCFIFPPQCLLPPTVLQVFSCCLYFLTRI